MLSWGGENRIRQALYLWRLKITTTGTTVFNPAFADLALEAFQRIQVKSTSLTPEHMFACHMSANLALAEWNVKGGPNLWKVQLLSIPLVQGIPQYSVPPNVISILDYYVRTFTLGNAINYTPAFSTTVNSTSVTVTLPNHDEVVGNWLEIVIPVAVGGMILFGFYQVVSIIDINNFTITSAQTASATSSGGVVPVFGTTAATSNVQVTLPAHGLGIGSVFIIQSETLVGGVILFGSYTVTNIIDINNFVINAGTAAGASTSVSENGGQTIIQTQEPDIDPIDLVILPISRSEYAQQPDKFLQARPTSVWFDRLVTPSVYMWPTPDGNGPYVLYFYALVQLQDATLAQGATIDVPVRFLEAFAAELAARLAVKFNPAIAPQLRQDAERTWTLAAHQDVEEVPLYIIPGLGGYFR